MTKKVSKKPDGMAISGDVSISDLEKYEAMLKNIAGQCRAFREGMAANEMATVRIRGFKKIERGSEIVLDWCDNMDAAIHVEARRRQRG